MIRHRIESRPDWQNKVADCGVDPGDTPSSWCEHACYEISQSEANLVHDLTEGIYHLMIEATDEVIESGQITNFCPDMSLLRPLIASWENGDYYPTLLTRFDFEWNPVFGPQLARMSLSAPTLLLESAVAQWRWIEECIPWGTQFNHIQERLISLWRDYRYAGKSVHFSYPDDHYESFLVAEYLEDLAREAGVDSHLTASSNLYYDPDSEQIRDNLDRTVERLIRTGTENAIGSLPLNQAFQLDSLCIAEPLWKTLWSHPDWIGWVKKRFTGNELVEHIKGVSPACPALLCCSWIIAGIPSGIGFLEQETPGKRRFVPHLLDAVRREIPQETGSAARPTA